MCEENSTKEILARLREMAKFINDVDDSYYIRLEPKDRARERALKRYYELKEKEHRSYTDLVNQATWETVSQPDYNPETIDTIEGNVEEL